MGSNLQMRPLSPARGPAPPPADQVQERFEPEEFSAGSSERAHPGLQRDSMQIQDWRNRYESSLGLQGKLSQLRLDALRQGGPEMLYRMYPLLFQQDLQGPYQTLAQLLPTKGPEIALTGDCHLGNFGTLRHGNGDVVWTMNDYDQVGRGGPESDLCRAGASLALLCKERGWGSKMAESMVAEMTRRYCSAIEEYAQSGPPGGPLGLTREQAHEPVSGLIKKAERRTQEEMLAKWAEPHGHSFRFKLGDELHPLEPVQSDRLDHLLEQVKLPANVEVLDRCCRWDAGGSSLGLERYYLLARRSGESLPVVVEIKQVLPCALATSDSDPKQTDADLLRNGFKWMKAPEDSWQRVIQGDNGVYLMRERQRARDSIRSEEIDPADATKLARQMGKVLAQAHANGGGARQVAAWIDGQEELLSRNLYEFSHTYSNQVRQDFQELFRAPG